MADNAQKASGSSAGDIRHSEIWSLLEEYADIRDELEKLLPQLDTCSARLMRFRAPRNKPHGTIEASREFLVDG